MRIAVDAAVLTSTVLALTTAPRLTRREADSPPSRRRAWARPEVFLLLAVSLVYVNQVLFTIYVMRVHDGDPSFIAKYLPEGWFALADNHTVRTVSDQFPWPDLLAPSVLRVQAFFELPLVLLAYATVLRWLDSGLYRRVAGSWALWAASVSYTVVFCVIEWDLHNPYTVDDIAIRACSAVATPLLLRWLAGHEQDAQTPVSFPHMLLFAVSVWALGHLVLTVYDTALLYNLGHLGGRLPGAAVALCALLAARYTAPRLQPTQNAGVALSSIAGVLRWTLLLLFIPALAIRYGVNFGTPIIAALAGLLVCVAAATCALRKELAGAAAPRIALWTAQAAAALLAGGVAGYAAVRLVTDTYYEAGLLRGAGTCFAVAVATCALSDVWIARHAGETGGPGPVT